VPDRSTLPLQFAQLLPELASVEPRELIAGLGAGAPGAELPHTIVNFVVSVDGRVAIDGRSGGLSDAGDRVIFHALRERADAILAGTGTLAKENYGRLIPSADARARRVAAGRPAEPLACVITRSGAVPLSIPLFAEPEAVVVVFSPTPPALDGIRAQVRHVPISAEDPSFLQNAFATLRSDFGVGLLLCEGGPRLVSSLLHEGLVDELFLTLAPKLAGGDSGPTLTVGEPLPQPDPMRLTWLLHQGESLYLRYAIDRSE
jgi:riboflavin biosynthesis pyrimidine reductase